VSWPYGHKFAFTIFDDTDWATIDRVKPIYDLLIDLGMRTTKSVWVFRGEGSSTNAGMTCEDGEYLEWVLSLQAKGFEIGLHNAAPATSPRELTQKALERFKELFGEQPIVHCNHVGCLDNIYWGDNRLSGWRRWAYNVLTRGRRRDISQGHIDGDPMFWGDLCREQVRYVRNFVFDELNSLAICPEMPYHDPGKPYVNYWFVSADGGSWGALRRNFTSKKINKLEDEGGLCIAYVHFADKFASNGVVHTELRDRLEYISSKDVWCAPVSEVLNHLRVGKNPEHRIISESSLHRLEIRWLVKKLSEMLQHTNIQFAYY
jgi:hypothetical protein